jgi:hypothetical protein
MKLRWLIMLVAYVLGASPVIHKFIIWKVMNEHEKAVIYGGWTNGFLQGRDASAAPLATCLEAMGREQAIATIDKYFKEHPERWSRLFGEQVLEALTAEGGPCEGKKPINR